MWWSASVRPFIFMVNKAILNIICSNYPMNVEICITSLFIRLNLNDYVEKSGQFWAFLFYFFYGLSMCLVTIKFDIIIPYFGRIIPYFVFNYSRSNPTLFYNSTTDTSFSSFIFIISSIVLIVYYKIFIAINSKY